jgi:hypothetical protein
MLKIKRLAVLAGSVALLAGCGGQSTVNPKTAAKYIEDGILHKTGHRVDVTCPSGIPAKTGGRFNCHFAGPEGPYTAYARIVNVQGSRVGFRWESQPTSWPPPGLQ